MTDKFPAPLPTYLQEMLQPLLDKAHADGMRYAAAIAGSMAERPYDNEPEFSAVLAVEAAIIAAIK